MTVPRTTRVHERHRARPCSPSTAARTLCSARVPRSLALSRPRTPPAAFLRSCSLSPLLLCLCSLARFAHTDARPVLLPLAHFPSLQRARSHAPCPPCPCCLPGPRASRIRALRARESCRIARGFARGFPHRIVLDPSPKSRLFPPRIRAPIQHGFAEHSLDSRSIRAQNLARKYAENRARARAAFALALLRTRIGKRIERIPRANRRHSRPHRARFPHAIRAPFIPRCFEECGE